MDSRNELSGRACVSTGSTGFVPRPRLEPFRRELAISAANPAWATPAGAAHHGSVAWQRRVRQVEKENVVTTADTRVVWCGTASCEERAADGVIPPDLDREFLKL